MNHSINQPIQPTNTHIDGPINPSINQLNQTHQSITQCVNHPITQSASNQPTNQPITPVTHQSSQPISDNSELTSSHAAYSSSGMSLLPTMSVRRPSRANASRCDIVVSSNSWKNNKTTTNTTWFGERQRGHIHNRLIDSVMGWFMWAAHG